MFVSISISALCLSICVLFILFSVMVAVVCSSSQYRLVSLEVPVFHLEFCCLHFSLIGDYTGGQ